MRTKDKMRGRGGKKSGKQVEVRRRGWSKRRSEEERLE